jgi:hypothetical protein
MTLSELKKLRKTPLTWLEGLQRHLAIWHLVMAWRSLNPTCSDDALEKFKALIEACEDDELHNFAHLGRVRGVDYDINRNRDYDHG